MSTEGAAGASTGPLAAPPAAAIASPAPGRHGKLPPSPASTFMRPQQLLQRQRAAERAAVEQDAAALAQLLGASMELGPIAEASEQPLQPQASSVAMPERSNAPASGAAVENGILTGATLQALLVQQPSKRWQGQGQPGPGLGAEPSVLASYIAGTEEDSRLLQRQMTHLQATTSGGAGASGRAAGWAAVGAPPPPLRSARSMPGRREVFVLSKWLEVGRGSRTLVQAFKLSLAMSAPGEHSCDAENAPPACTSARGVAPCLPAQNPRCGCVLAGGDDSLQRNLRPQGRAHPAGRLPAAGRLKGQGHLQPGIR